MREPTLEKVNADIRELNKSIQKDEQLILLMRKQKSVEDIQKEIDHKKEIIKSLQHIKEKLS